MSLLISHLAMVPPAAWALGVGLMINSATLFGNAGAGLVGAVPIAREQLGVTGMSEKHKVRIWALFFKGAAGYIVPGVIASSALHLLAAYLTPSPRIRQLALVAAGMSALILPHTLAFIMPINKLLLAMDGKAELTPAEKKDVPYLISRWETLHRWRYVEFAVGWTAGLGALLGTAGRW